MTPPPLNRREFVRRAALGTTALGLSLARYWAARELTGIERGERAVKFHAPFACPDFTVRCPAGAPPGRPLRLRVGTTVTELREVSSPLRLEAATWHRAGEQVVACFPLPKGNSHWEWS